MQRFVPFFIVALCWLCPMAQAAPPKPADTVGTVEAYGIDPHNPEKYALVASGTCVAVSKEELVTNVGSLQTAVVIFCSVQGKSFTVDASADNPEIGLVHLFPRQSQNLSAAQLLDGLSVYPEEGTAVTCISKGSGKPFQVVQAKIAYYTATKLRSDGGLLVVHMVANAEKAGSSVGGGIFDKDGVLLGIVRTVSNKGLLIIPVYLSDAAS